MDKDNVIPIFKSHYSLGKSILTLEPPTEDKTYPRSCLSICKDYGISKFILVDDNMSGFLQAYESSKELGVQLIFGVRITVCADMEEKNQESLKTNNKVVIFAKNSEGYKKLIKIYTLAARKGFYYEPRIDSANLKKLWDNNLKLCIPFYDSFIHANLIKNSLCVPEFDFTELTFFSEENELPFNSIIQSGIEKFVGAKKDIIKVKSIYYEKKEDFKAYLTFKCINNRTTLDKPNLDHMTSNEFCIESWKEENGTV
tara:strand:- start:345 stop:1112 length:768 start_codon:yes stop_codon:yes gene_type:complete